MDIGYSDIIKCKLATLGYSREIIHWLMDATQMRNHFTHEITNLDVPYKFYRMPLWDNRTYALVDNESVFSIVHVSSACAERVQWLELLPNQSWVNSDDTQEVNIALHGKILTVAQIHYVDGRSNKANTGLLQVSDALQIANQAYSEYLRKQANEEKNYED